MAYLGNTPTTQSFISGTDYFNGDNATIAFTLSRAVVSVNDIEVVINNVVQQPNTAYTISGTTITFTSAPSAGTSNIYVRYLSTTTQSITPSQGTVSYSTLNSDNQSKLGISYKNRIINGAQVISQYNGTSTYTPSGTGGVGLLYTIDRFRYAPSQASKMTFQQTATVPTGFSNSTKISVAATATVGSSDYFLWGQPIEGFNTADLNWGTVNAKTVTLSFWIYSSTTGTFGGSLNNVSYTRSYPYTYTINAANTWEYKTVTITGCQDGTWATDNTTGIYVWFSLGSGSTVSAAAGAWASGSYYSATGATSIMDSTSKYVYITGVQLEVGTQATTFDYRSYGTELALCQRYYYRFTNNAGYAVYPFVLAAYGSGAAYGKLLDLPVTMRSTPTCSTSGSFVATNSTGNATTAFTLTPIDCPSQYLLATNAWSGSSGLSAGNATGVYTANGNYIQASAEL